MLIISNYHIVKRKAIGLDALGESSCRNSLPWSLRSVRTLHNVSCNMGVAWRT